MVSPVLEQLPASIESRVFILEDICYLELLAGIERCAETLKVRKAVVCFVIWCLTTVNVPQLSALVVTLTCVEDTVEILYS